MLTRLAFLSYLYVIKISNAPRYVRDVVSSVVYTIRILQVYYNIYMLNYYLFMFSIDHSVLTRLSDVFIFYLSYQLMET